MSNKILIKRSSTPNAIPTTGQLEQAELAINLADGLLFTKNNSNQIIKLNETPTGAVQYFAMNTPPTGWLKANGAAVSRSTYAALFAAIGTTFGAGNGSTTFNLPDLRGEFLRGWDDGRGVDSGRSFGSLQGDAIRNMTGQIKLHNNNQFANGVFRQLSSFGGNSAWGGGTFLSAEFDASRQVPTADEARPRNVAMLACIKF